MPRPGRAQVPGEPERTVTAVRFAGNRALDDYTLSIAIATTKSTWTYSNPVLRFIGFGLGFGTRRVFDELEFRRDALRLQLFYRQNGYFEARVDTVVRRSARTVQVTFRVQEGTPVIVDSITISGLESAVSERELLRRLPLATGRPFNRLLFDFSADSILFALRDAGYPFAAVFRNYSVDRAAHRARVSYDVLAGPRARIGAVEVTGRRGGVAVGTVRRFLAVREGDPYRQRALFDSQRALYQSDLFRYAAVGLAPESTVRGVDSLVRVRVQVTEGPPARVRVGAGYGTIDCIRTQATASLADFLGGARRLDLSGKLSKIGVGAPGPRGLQNSLCPALEQDRFSDTLSYAATVTLTQPALVTRRTVGSVSVFAERRSEFKAYENVGAGGAAALVLGAGGRLPLTVTYRLAHSRTNADQATFCTSFDRCDSATVALLGARRRQGSLAVALAASTVNSPIDPTTGRVVTMDVTAAARALFSQVVFGKVSGEAAWYHTLSRGWVAAVRVRAGVIRTGTSTVADSAIRFVPPEERFYAGGPTTVRGYGRNEMGPVVFVTTDSSRVTVDTSGLVTRCEGCRTSPLGSSALALGNLELRMPSPVWGGRLRLAAFVDAGQLWEQTDAFGLVPSGVRVTPGAGIRFVTPLGPMRVDVAYNHYAPTCGAVFVVTGGILDRAGTADFCPPREGRVLKRLQFHFSVGQAF